MPSYSSSTRGIRRRLRELSALYIVRTRATSETVNQLTEDAEALEKVIMRLRGVPLSGSNILEVGPGHFFVQSSYFAQKNTVTTIDTDVLPSGINPLNYMSMLVHNGLQRSAKTIIRKMLGVDARYRKCLRARLSISALPSVRALRGDVCKMEFADSSFDVVFCRSVLHHLSDPAVALSEMARVLRPGGVAIVDVHLYTSYNGSLDPRVISGSCDETLFWAHLRPQMAPDFRGNSFLNKLGLDEWRSAFSSSWPGCTIETEKSSRAGIEESAKTMIESGAIVGYGIEELTTHTILAVWRKPLACHDRN